MGLPFTMRAEVKEMIAQRENMEAEIEALSSALQADGMPGVSGPLVDREGFPLANVDVHLVRDYRHRLICLHNDHKALTNRIEKALHETLSADSSSRASHEPQPPAAHAGAPSEPGGTSARAAVNGSLAGLPADSPALPPPPFATVGELSPGSLAASAGLEVGDLILQFGSVRGDNHRNNASAVQAMAPAVAEGAGAVLPVTVRRGADIRNLELRPSAGTPLGMRVLPL